MRAELRTRLRAAGLFVFVMASDQIVKSVLFPMAPSLLFCNQTGPWGFRVTNEAAIIMAVGVLLVALYLWHISLISTYPLVLLSGAGLSNLADRAVFGCVRDFAVISWYPAFNLADVFLTIGVLAVMWGTVSHWKRPAPVAQ